MTAPVGSRIGIGVDVGTSGVRAVALDAVGTRFATAAKALPAPLRTAGGGVQQDPACWWQAVTAVLRSVAAGAALRERRCCVCLDGTSATVLLADADGRPLGPALMYNDRSAADAAAQVAAAAPADSPALGVGSSLAKALHLLAAAAADAHRCHVLHQADWLTGCLLGRFGDSDWNNALKLGFDPAVERWPDWLAGLPLPARALPKVHAPGLALGSIAPRAAEATGLPPDTLICAGTTDSTAAVLATGASEPGDAVTSLGSTLVLKIIAEQPVTASDYGVYSHRLRDQWLVGGASNSGGAVLRAYFDDAALARLSARIDPDLPSGLDYYPLAGPGERFPVQDPSLPPRLTPRPPDDVRFLHGLLEGIARIERDGYHLLTGLGAPTPSRVLSIGGGAGNAVWTAMRRRLLGVEVAPAPEQEAAAGVARLAVAAL
ncbi:MAG: FGGY-family carbohydrate kinase [Thiohalocapsa sp.]